MDKIFQTMEYHLLNDTTPSNYLKRFFETQESKQYPFELLQKLKHTKQSPIHHPEGSAWNHTMLVVDYAARLRSQSKSPREFMWAALLHDIGKPDTTRVRKGRITSYDHDVVGAKIAEEFLLSFTKDTDFIKRVTNLIRYHMQILFVVKDMPYQDIPGIRQHVDINELALMGFADRMGRTNADEEEVKHIIHEFVQKLNDKN